MDALGCAPVVLLGYRRPERTAEVFQAIRGARPAKLFLVMDGPRAKDTSDDAAVANTRRVVEDVDWPAEVIRIYAETNMGLKARVSSGLDQVFAEVEEAIILEDDCLPSPDFFRYATELLQRYRDEEHVGIVSGSSRLRGATVSEFSYDFSADVRIWGWATWGRTWRKFSQSGDLDARWDPEDQSRIIHYFAPGARRKSMSKMLARSNELDSWALPFAVHCAEAGYVNPVPNVNLVKNIGLGSSSTHTKFRSWVAELEWGQFSFPMTHPPTTAVNRLLDAQESRQDSRELFRFPLRHPFQALARLVAYALLVVVQRLRRGKDPL